MIYSIIIEPIEMIVGWVYSFFINKFTFLGVIGAIYGVSMVINFNVHNLRQRASDK